MSNWRQHHAPSTLRAADNDNTTTVLAKTHAQIQTQMVTAPDAPGSQGADGAGGAGDGLEARVAALHRDVAAAQAELDDREAALARARDHEAR